MSVDVSVDPTGCVVLVGTEVRLWPHEASDLSERLDDAAWDARTCLALTRLDGDELDHYVQTWIDSLMPDLAGDVRGDAAAMTRHCIQVHRHHPTVAPWGQAFEVSCPDGDGILVRTGGDAA